MKDSFLLYVNQIETFEQLTDKQAGKLIKGIYAYAATGELPELEPLLKMAFTSIKQSIDRNAKKYEEKCKRNKENGKLGGRPKKANGFEENPEKPNGFEENRMVQKKPDSDSDNDNDSDSDNDNDSDNKLNNSVCNNTHTREETFNCHLGSHYKSESCFKCMKKYRCPLCESADFKLKHNGQTFEEWNQQKERLYEEWCQVQLQNNNSTNIDLFDYDWLNEEGETDGN